MSKIVIATVELDNYIDHPYWPATELVIDIDLKSGKNRLKIDEKKKAAVTAECEKRGLTYEDYEEAVEASKVKWHVDGDGHIVIPRHKFAGAFVQAIGNSPKAVAGVYTKDNFRSLVHVGDFVTAKTESDGIFGRFVKLEGSNKRVWQENDFIGQAVDCKSNEVVGGPFQATGQLIVRNWEGDGDDKHLKSVENLLKRVLTSEGVGAARKMGFGRGRIVGELQFK